MTIQIPTVLVLGAASSLHCGYPLGMTLISKITELPRQCPSLHLPSIWTHADLLRFTQRLSRSGHYSIDAFLETVPEEMRLGKYLIALCLKQLESVDRLFPPNDSGWYQYLLSSLLGSSVSPFSGNQLTIVTYNYDRSLEAYLYHALIARFGMTDVEATEELARIPIIHVHGILGKFPEVAYEQAEDPNTLLSVSDCIKIIHELGYGHESFCNNEFEKANQAILSSEKVAFLGFGFHVENIRRLRIDWSAIPSRKVFSTFAGVYPLQYERMIARLSQYGLCADVLKYSGTYGCKDFFDFVMTLE